MRIAVFSTQRFERPFLERANEAHRHDLAFFEARLDSLTAPLAAAFDAVCIFVSDIGSREVLEKLAEVDVRLIALRSAGFNHVDIAAASELGLTVLRVPAYSPWAVAEHTVGLILTLDRKLHRAIARVRELDFSLHGLLGFDLHGRTAGIVGTGQIGAAVAHILTGFGCVLLGHDVRENDECIALGMRYVTLEELVRESDIVTLHCPLTPETHHLIDRRVIDAMKPGAMLINTSRGAVIDTRAVIQGLKTGRIGYLGLDVYEEEGDLFFRDLSDTMIQDDVFARLLTFPNVVITAHQAFFTREALEKIATVTMANATAFERGALPPENVVDERFVRKA